MLLFRRVSLFSRSEVSCALGEGGGGVGVGPRFRGVGFGAARSVRNVDVKRSLVSDRLLLPLQALNP